MYGKPLSERSAKRINNDNFTVGKLNTIILRGVFYILVGSRKLGLKRKNQNILPNFKYRLYYPVAVLS